MVEYSLGIIYLITEVRKTEARLAKRGLAFISTDPFHCRLRLLERTRVDVFLFLGALYVVGI